ncbi:hypothetical protein XM50_00880 [Sphingomonas sp. Ag1]|nr:hypothetical protein XM50_00880 [Sphingomonas sp. Ag1]
MSSLAGHRSAKLSFDFCLRMGDRYAGITGAGRHEDAALLRGKVAIYLGFGGFRSGHLIFSGRVIA